MRKPENREAASILLQALLQECLSGGRPVEVEIDCEQPQSQKSRWPLKPLRPSLVLPVHDGRLDLSSWKAAIDDPLVCQDTLLDWYKACGLGDEGDDMLLAGLLKRSLTDCPQLHCQLLTQVASKCEQGIYLAMSPSDKVPSPPIGCWFAAVLDTMDCPNKLNNHLLRHVYGGVEAIRRFLNIGPCNDKASVCGVTLDKGCFIMPNNMCSIAVPQALDL